MTEYLLLINGELIQGDNKIELINSATEEKIAKALDSSKMNRFRAIDLWF